MGSPIGRLPLFRQLLLSPSSPFSSSPTKLLVVPPRSYYLSTPTKPTQTGLLHDYRTVLEYAWRTYPGQSIVLYGHSLGGTAACCLLGRMKANGRNSIEAVVLENAFPSVSKMITHSLYPSRNVYLPFFLIFITVLFKSIEKREKGRLLLSRLVFFSRWRRPSPKLILWPAHRVSSLSPFDPIRA